MSDFILYLITRLDFLNGLFFICTTLSAVAGFIALVLALSSDSLAGVDKYENRDKEEEVKEESEKIEKSCFRFIKLAIVSFILFLVLTAVTPASKYAMIAYGVSHIDSSETVEKFNNLLDKLAESD